MKKIILAVSFALFALIAMPGNFFAVEPTNYQNFELDTLLHEIDKPGAPYVTNDYIIFTADIHNRHVGIAFDFENYKVIHPFQILTHTDDEGNVSRKHMFYCFKREHKFTKLKYRLVIDGLWTTDPLNPQKVYDDNVNLYFSTVDLPDSIEVYTTETPQETVRFIYKGKTGLKLNLAGTFTNWDPWIYEVPEVEPGLYELELPLTTGTYYYTYYIGLTPVLDNTNPNKAYAADGRRVNVIKVK